MHFLTTQWSFCVFCCRRPVPQEHHLQGVPLQRVRHGEELHQPVPGRVPRPEDPQLQLQEERAEDRAVPGTSTSPAPQSGRPVRSPQSSPPVRSLPPVPLSVTTVLWRSGSPRASTKKMNQFLSGLVTAAGGADPYSMCFFSLEWLLHYDEFMSLLQPDVELL